MKSFANSPCLQGLKMFFYIACCMYVLYLGLLLLRAYTELRSMPYFGEQVVEFDLNLQA